MLLLESPAVGAPGTASPNPFDAGPQTFCPTIFDSFVGPNDIPEVPPVVDAVMLPTPVDPGTGSSNDGADWSGSHIPEDPRFTNVLPDGHVGGTDVDCPVASADLHSVLSAESIEPSGHLGVTYPAV